MAGIAFEMVRTPAPGEEGVFGCPSFEWMDQAPNCSEGEIESPRSGCRPSRLRDGLESFQPIALLVLEPQTQ